MNVLDLAVHLMEAESTTGEEGPVLGLAEELLSTRGWGVERIAVSDGRWNLVARREAEPLVTLSTHLDTVPPYIPPRVDGGRLWGRGACDAKGIAASMICAAERLAERGVAVGLLFVVGEEVTHDGAHAANAWRLARGRTNRVLVNGEPTESTLAVGTKGAVRAVVRVAGEAAHSAYPHLGRSAIMELARLLVELDALDLPSDPLLGETTVNVGIVSGGVADNVVAASAEARLMARLVGPTEEVEAALERWVAGRATLERGGTIPAVHLGTLDGFATSIAAYATDIPALTHWGTPYLYGPGSIHVAHRDDEHVEIEALERAIGDYERIAEAALAKEMEIGRG